MNFKVLIASLAFVAFGGAVAEAADLPVHPAPPPLAPLVANWTGFYLGANVGGAWANNNWTDTFQTSFNNGNVGVFIGGGQIGGNYQIGQFVVGGEWDFDWASNNNNNGGNGIAQDGSNITVTDNNRWITTVAARFGAAIDQLLIYGKAGWGWVGDNNLAVTNLTTGASLTCGSFTTCGNNSDGWLVGVGAEWLIVPNVSVKFEYDYLALSSRTFVIPATAPLLAGDTFISKNRDISMVKVGVNYLFNWATPVAARY